MPKIRISLFVLCMLICLGLGSTSQGQPFQVKSVPGLVYKTVGTTQLKLNLFLPVRADGTIVKGTPLLTNIVGGCFYSGQPGNGGYWTKWKMVEAGYA
ncbi:MAG: hypothetical protein PHQ75_10695, partial [Thermoguttaceae bacterium]|nr:hypothetical protein [Thermoguttaceae bacterium]